MNTSVAPYLVRTSPLPVGDQAVTTLALLIRKDGMRPDLFSRYWRDVHGVLAARIPGFESYIQYHLDEPLDDILPEEVAARSRVRPDARFDGLAEVGFHDVSKRAGLATSDVTEMIQRDERNVFRTSLLFNLDKGASRTVFDKSAAERSSVFVLLGGASGSTCASITAALDELLLPSLRSMRALCGMRVHVLLSGEQQSWRTEGVDNQQTAETAFDAIVQLDFEGESGKEILAKALATVPPELYHAIVRLQVYPARASYVMVDRGRPAELALRGLDVQRTIGEAGAENQRTEAVIRCVFGESAVRAYSDAV